MRVFTTECKDSITGYAMVLSECSYNMACDWLERTLAKYGVEICGMYLNKEKQVVELYSSYIGNNSKLCRTYYYDEIRGVLLGE